MARQVKGNNLSEMKRGQVNCMSGSLFRFFDSVADTSLGGWKELFRSFLQPIVWSAKCKKYFTRQHHAPGVKQPCRNISPWYADKVCYVLLPYSNWWYGGRYKKQNGTKFLFLFLFLSRDTLTEFLWSSSQYAFTQSPSVISLGDESATKETMSPFRKRNLHSRKVFVVWEQNQLLKQILGATPIYNACKDFPARSPCAQRYVLIRLIVPRMQ